MWEKGGTPAEANALDGLGGGGDALEEAAGGESGLFGLGRRRSLAQYAKFVGVDLRRGVTAGSASRCADVAWVRSATAPFNNNAEAGALRDDLGRGLAGDTALASGGGKGDSIITIDDDGNDDAGCEGGEPEQDLGGVGGYTEACHRLGHVATLAECEAERKRRRCGALTYKHQQCFLHDPFGESRTAAGAGAGAGAAVATFQSPPRRQR